MNHIIRPINVIISFVVDTMTEQQVPKLPPVKGCMRCGAPYRSATVPPGGAMLPPGVSPILQRASGKMPLWFYGSQKNKQHLYPAQQLQLHQKQLKLTQQQLQLPQLVQLHDMDSMNGAEKVEQWLAHAKRHPKTTRKKEHVQANEKMNDCQDEKTKMKKIKSRSYIVIQKKANGNSNIDTGKEMHIGILPSDSGLEKYLEHKRQMLRPQRDNTFTVGSGIEKSVAFLGDRGGPIARPHTPFQSLRERQMTKLGADNWYNHHGNSDYQTIDKQREQMQITYVQLKNMLQK